MKRASKAAAPRSPFAQLCERLGVQPKQFAILLAVAGGSILLLTGKWLLTPRGAGASPAPSAGETAPPAPAPAAAPSAAAPSPVDDAPHDDESRGERERARESDEIVLALDTTPRRDPFQPFVERASVDAEGLVEAAPGAGLTREDLEVFQLRATMDGAWVVINGQTLKQGETVGLAPDGAPITLRAVGHRTATLEWRGKTFEIEFTR